uniref:ATP synthase complex subunit 8 n=1 Tax=Doryrhamphus excisus TaxID=161450 RepID=Q0ZY35_DOREX|nr:ATPase subunit 8 [Doryrhamphus excisus]ABA11340.1 ATPase subunit 8 [Doryrhamphus excisus]ABA11342.1 ATPase subunit 8 [Doryrhamphus excisus]ABA11344.1 ATPase subunit 8 [Doryrhamphus excisus]ABA11346.1 ATPase subunit 8 [Doryrhamphus excisus]
MPQLNPSPWLAILLFSWAVLVSTVPIKIMSHKFPNSPAPSSSKVPQNKFWNWPWH